MLQNLRNQVTGVVAYVIVGAIALTFVLFGITEYFDRSAQVSDVASVDGNPVTNIDLERALQSQRSFIVEQLGDDFDPSLIESATLIPPVMNALVDQKVLEVSALDAGLAISDEVLGQTIRGMEIFQVGGSFSETTFRTIVSQMGYSTLGFVEAIEGEGVVGQLQAGVLNGAFHSKQELEQIFTITDEKRDYQYVTISGESFTDAASVTEEMISEYFEQNRQNYIVPEQVAVSYIQVDRNALVDFVEISESEISDRYQEIVGALADRREAAHILLTPQGDDESDLERIADVQARLDAGEEFEVLAEEYSDDIFSAASGGVLGFSNGSTFPAEFELALSQLEVGQVSSPVVTDSGTHFVKLLSYEEGSATPLEELRDSITFDLKVERAEGQYQTLLSNMGSISYATDSLEELLDELDTEIPLVIQESELFSRDGGVGIAESPLVRQIAFSTQVLENGENSDPISIDEESAVFIHLLDRQASREATLAEVFDPIQELLVVQEVSKLTENFGQTVISRISDGESLEDISYAENLDWQVAIDAGRSVGDITGFYAFNITPGQGAVGNPLGNGDYVVVQLDSVTPGQFVTLPQQQQWALNIELSLLEADVALDSYKEFMRNHRDVDVN